MIQAYFGLRGGEALLDRQRVPAMRMRVTSLVSARPKQE